VKLLILLTAYVGFETETKNSKLKITTAFQNRFKRRQEKRESKMSTIHDDDDDEGDGDEDEGDGVLLETQHSNGTIGRERLTLAGK
jgi:hypothetical protein